MNTIFTFLIIAVGTLLVVWSLVGLFVLGLFALAHVLRLKRNLKIAILIIAFLFIGVVITIAISDTLVIYKECDIIYGFKNQTIFPHTIMFDGQPWKCNYNGTFYHPRT